MQRKPRARHVVSKSAWLLGTPLKIKNDLLTEGVLQVLILAAVDHVELLRHGGIPCNCSLNREK